eukprot:2318018-Amphidinium_carterae.1
MKAILWRCSGKGEEKIVSGLQVPLQDGRADVNCLKTKGSTSTCEDLNCYTSDECFAISALVRRAPGNTLIFVPLCVPIEAQSSGVKTVPFTEHSMTSIEAESCDLDATPSGLFSSPSGFQGLEKGIVQSESQGRSVRARSTATEGCCM